MYFLLTVLNLKIEYIQKLYVTTYIYFYTYFAAFIVCNLFFNTLLQTSLLCVVVFLFCLLLLRIFKLLVQHWLFHKKCNP